MEGGRKEEREKDELRKEEKGRDGSVCMSDSYPLHMYLPCLLTLVCVPACLLPPEMCAYLPAFLTWNLQIPASYPCNVFLPAFCTWNLRLPASYPWNVYLPASYPCNVCLPASYPWHVNMVASYPQNIGTPACLLPLLSPIPGLCTRLHPIHAMFACLLPLECLPTCLLSM